MGLEVATWISQLVATNPLAGDKKNQGDDHFRLLKTVIQNTLPNADRPFRFPEIVSKNANYNIVEADDNKVIFCDVSAGSITLTLPVGLSYDGWQVTIIKGTNDANPVFISGTVFTPVGSVAKVRASVPWSETRILWNGGAFQKMTPVGELPPGTPIPHVGGAVPAGFVQCLGQSFLRADYPELFASLGTTWGAADGTHFSLPNLADRFLAGAGVSYALGATGGANNVTIAQANLPNYTLPKTLALNDPGHSHVQNHQLVTFAAGGGSIMSVATPGGNAWSTGSNATGMSLTGDTQSGGSGTALDVRPLFTAVNFLLRLC